MSERNGYAHGVPCWVDTWVADTDAAAAFYTELLGWDAARGEYSMFQHRGLDVAGLGASDELPPGWTTYIWVDDADATAEAARAAGGRLVREPFDSLDGGRIAIVEDPAGAVFGVWQVGEHRGAAVVNEPGAWAISALSTPDADGANAFYGAVFGWEAEAFGPMTLYRLPGYVGGEPTQPVPRDVIAAMMAGEQAAWIPNFWVPDADAAAETAARLGGTVIAPVADDGVGRSGVLADPAGAVFSVAKVV
ncbi:MAG TPA: VOC family protein [Solirubrobacteraceae bacterium]|nr:VOC family protein [Solirubrobacteraceae bacterium]